MASLKFPQLQPFTLYASGVNVGDTQMVLSSFKSIDGVLLTMADFGDKGFLTVDPAAGSLEESITFSGVTQNANGTATLTGIKSAMLLSPFTETSGFSKQHSGGASVVAAITSALLKDLVDNTNDETILGTYTFSNPNVPRMDVEPTYGVGTELQFVTKQYADALAIAGAPNASTTQKGIVQTATQGQADNGTTTGSTGADLFLRPDIHLKTMDKVIVSATYGATIAAGNLLYLDTADNKWKVADGAVAATSFTAFGIALDAGVDTDTGKRVQVGGLVSGLAGLTTGYAYAGTAGALSSTPGTFSKVAGYATSATTLLLIPTLDVAALAGVNANGTTANLNKSLDFAATTTLTGSQANALVGGGDQTDAHFHRPSHFDIFDGNVPAIGSTAGALSNRSQIQITTSADGAYMYIATIGNRVGGNGGDINIYLLLRDTSTGQYYFNGTSVNLTPGAGDDLSTSGTNVGICAGSTYVYVCSLNNAGSDLMVKRYNLDLSSKTSITISGAALATPGYLCGNDSVLYVCDQGASTNFYPYTISGTTAARGTTFTITERSDYRSGLYFDGTYIYFMNNNSNNDIKKYSTTGVLQSTTVKKFFNPGTVSLDAAGGIPVGIGFAKTGAIYLIGAFPLLSSADNFSSWSWKGYAIAKP